MLVVIAIIGILMGLLLPAVQQARESSRIVACKNNLHQLGAALHSYHGARDAFPMGCFEPTLDLTQTQAWGWVAFLLPYLEHDALHDSLGLGQDTLRKVLDDPARQGLLLTRLPVVRCPSDEAEDLTHNFRLVSAFDPNAFPFPLPPASLKHPNHPPFGGSGVYGVKVATSNYVASFGDYWNPNNGTWTHAELAGNGMFGSNAVVRQRDLSDGLSHTFAVGERTWHNYAAAWPGTDGWERCDAQGISMVMGTTYYRLNIDPQPYNLSCDGLGTAGYSSGHPGGAHFLLADGSVRFINTNISFQNSPTAQSLGIFQRLARRNDGQPLSF
jgi:prepilin-type processing-associated H-X9-DG protein